MIGQVVNYRYEILEKCGDGSFFAVYKARDKVLNRLVAVKILLPQYAANKEFAERVIAEAQSAVNLSHANIAKVFEADCQDGTYFIALEYVRGINLKDKMRRLAPFAPAQAVDLAIAVAEALDYAHKQAITHGDVRPQSVMVASDSQVKMTDFGMAAAVSMFPTIQTNTVLRSVHYMSPEVAEGKSPRPVSDVYSLGIVLYEMLTGTTPFDGDTAIAVALKHAKEPPPSPRSLNAGVPKTLEAIVLKTLQKAPEDRYHNMQELIQDLRSARQQLEAPLTVSRIEPPEDKEDIDLGVQEKESPGLLSGVLKVGFVLFAVGLVGLVFMLLYLFLGFGATEEVTTPLLLGKTQAEAETLADSVGVRLTPAGEEFDDEYPPGQIYLTVPEAGMKVKKGQNIRIWISRGSRYISVPEVIGMPEDKARSEIMDSGLTVGESVQVYDDKAPIGNVVKQSPNPGTPLERGKPVRLTFSMGKEPEPEPITPETPVNPDNTSGGTREFEVKVNVRPEGPDPRKVRITVDEGGGERVVYEQDHHPGDSFSRVVTATGRGVTIRTYVNNRLVKTFVSDQGGE